MRSAFVAVCAALLMAGCGQHEPYEYPAAAHAQFAASCPPSSKVCVCTWDQITRAMTYEDYQAALSRYNERGLMDPRVTHARTICLERGEK
jgi:hypothetical protein